MGYLGFLSLIDPTAGAYSYGVGVAKTLDLGRFGFVAGFAGPIAGPDGIALTGRATVGASIQLAGGKVRPAAYSVAVTSTSVKILTDNTRWSVDPLYDFRVDKEPYRRWDQEVGGWVYSGYTGKNSGYDAPSEHIEPGDRPGGGGIGGPQPSNSPGFGPGSMADARAADRQSVPGYAGGTAQRDNQNTNAYGNSWGNGGFHSGSAFSSGGLRDNQSTSTYGGAWSGGSSGGVSSSGASASSGGYAGVSSTGGRGRNGYSASTAPGATRAAPAPSHPSAGTSWSSSGAVSGAVRGAAIGGAIAGAPGSLLGAIAGGLFSRFSSPVLLDLSGNGLSVDTLASSHAFLDMDGDGFQRHTAWAGAGTGVLVIDADGDGRISCVLPPQELQAGCRSARASGPVLPLVEDQGVTTHQPPPRLPSLPRGGAKRQRSFVRTVGIARPQLPVRRRHRNYHRPPAMPASS